MNVAVFVAQFNKFRILKIFLQMFYYSRTKTYTALKLIMPTFNQSTSAQPTQPPPHPTPPRPTSSSAQTNIYLTLTRQSNKHALYIPRHDRYPTTNTLNRCVIPSPILIESQVPPSTGTTFLQYLYIVLPRIMSFCRQETGDDLIRLRDVAHAMSCISTQICLRICTG